ncbi:MAG: restriction endonuclease subunit S [Candidatus Thiodiazotropha sp.]
MNIATIGEEIKVSFKPDKNSDYKYIALEHVDPDALYINGYGSSSEVDSNKYHFKTGDILFGTLRPYFRKLVIAPFDGVCSTEFSVIRAKKKEDKEFLFYCLANPKFIEFATTNSNGARPRTKWKLFSEFGVSDHDEYARVDIGKKLSDFDRLIENNNRRIELLEEAAHQLYKEWFVRLRFPGHEHVLIVNGVPDGWHKTPISEAPVQIIDGDRGKNYPKQDELLESGFCLFLSAKNVTRTGFNFSERQYITSFKDNLLRKGKLARGDVVLTTRGTIGNVAYYNNNVPYEHLRINSGMVIFRATNKNLTPSFLYQYFRSDEFNLTVNTLRSGAAQPKLPIKDINTIKILQPAPAIMEQFDAISSVLYEQVSKLNQYNQHLSSARDTMLPRLINKRSTA